MSDAFRDLDNYGNQAANLATESQTQTATIARDDRLRQVKGQIEENVGLLKAALGGKELTAGLVKGFKPYVKQQVGKAFNSSKAYVKQAVDAVKISRQVETDTQAATETRDALQLTHTANETARVQQEAAAQANVERAAADTLAKGGTDEEAAAAAAVQVRGSTLIQTANDAERAQEAADMGAANENVAFQAAGGEAKVARVLAEKAAAKASEDAAVEEGGEITASEGVAAAFDATGIGAPVGILLGALGIALGTRAEKHKPNVPPLPINESGATSQVGIN